MVCFDVSITKMAAKKPDLVTELNYKIIMKLRKSSLSSAIVVKQKKRPVSLQYETAGRAVVGTRSEEV